MGNFRLTGSYSRVFTVVIMNTKCLGIIIDNQLSWLGHIELICRSFGQKENQLKRLKYL